ncbi:MAG TPA: STAS domain-containing protein [Baekduia sp.]|nr:STAS domain-containing protein [Baekduia sp.]
MSLSGPSPFDLTIREDGGDVLIALRGELDVASAPQLEAALLPPVEAGRRAVLDLGQLEFMDSTGVRVLVTAHHAAEEHGGRLTLLRTPEGSPVHRVLEISGLDAVLEIVDER